MSWCIEQNNITYRAGTFRDRNSGDLQHYLSSKLAKSLLKAPYFRFLDHTKSSLHTCWMILNHLLTHTISLRVWFALCTLAPYQWIVLQIFYAVICCLLLCLWLEYTPSFTVFNLWQDRLYPWRWTLQHCPGRQLPLDRRIYESKIIFWLPIGYYFSIFTG